MSTDLYRKLNNINFSGDNYDIIVDYVLTGNLPSDFSEYKKGRYRRLFYKFFVELGLLRYPIDSKQKLTVIPDEDIEDTLQFIYESDKTGIGLGINSLYAKVSHQFLNITRDDVRDFMTKQPFYQMTKREPRIVNRPIIGKYPNNRWAIDLIDMSLYKDFNKDAHAPDGYRYILSGIDYFSKKIFATKMARKNTRETLDALKWCIQHQMGNTYPKILQSDNGGEFNNKFFIQWAKNPDNRPGPFTVKHPSPMAIKLIHTLSHSPTGNALVENSNNFIRKMIREGFIRHNNLNWID